MWRSIAFVSRQPGAATIAGLAVGVALFLVAVGLTPGALPYPPDALYSDAAITHWPYALYLHRTGFALWYPHIMSGIPFLANPLTKAWYLPQWAALVLEPALHIDLMVWLHLALAGAGLWTWARACEMAAWPAALAAVAYTFAPKVIAHLGAGHLDIVYAMAWFPWLLWAVRRACHPETSRTAASLRVGAVAALLFLADIRVSAFAFATAGAYGLWLLWRWRAPARRAAPLLGGGVVALALTAVQWAPLAALGPYLSRGALTQADAALFSLEPGHLLGMALADHGGFHESMTYAGLAVLVLAVVGLLAHPRRLGFWAAAVALAALYALGDNGPLWPLLAGVFPPLRWLRVPSRAWFVIALALPYMAGWGAHALAAGWRGGSRARLAVASLLGGGVVCGGAGALMLSGQLGAETTLAALAVALAVAAVIALALAGKLSRRAVAPLLLVIALADLLWLDRTLVEGRGRDYWLDPYAELAGYLVDAGAGRVYTPSDSLPQPAAAYWGINLFGGVDPFQIAAYQAMACRATRVPCAGYAPTIPPYTGEGPVETMWAGVTPDAEHMAQWHVTHAVSAFPIAAEGWAFDRRIGDVYVYRNAVQPPGALWPLRGLPAGAAAWEVAPAEVAAAPEAGALLSVSVPWLPGWRARAESGAAVDVQPGPDALTYVRATGADGGGAPPSLTLEYAPTAEYAGIAISAAALIVCAALWWRFRFGRRDAQGQTSAEER